jgi:hypothetical protein
MFCRILFLVLVNMNTMMTPWGKNKPGGCRRWPRECCILWRMPSEYWRHFRQRLQNSGYIYYMIYPLVGIDDFKSRFQRPQIT